jgi:hypothetical protein
MHKIWRWMISSVLVLVLLSVTIACAAPVPATVSLDPATYLNFNEGSSVYALDSSGHGNAGYIYGATRIENGGCGRALLFDGSDSYVSIPFSSGNHPVTGITVSLWFFTDSIEPQVLLSGYHNGGYRLAFDEGNDLWWTINLEGDGDISVPIRHEGITPGVWHHVTGTYDGYISKIYLDGILRNQINVTGSIHYENNNYIIVGADAGTYNTPDLTCPRYFHGGIDEVRIYDRALPYGEVMDDRFGCPTEPGVYAADLPTGGAADTCETSSGSVSLTDSQAVTRKLMFTNPSESGIWHVALPAGSRLIVKASDAYAKVYPDAWYVELGDENGRITRSIAFPNTNNAPVEGVIPSGNATVIVRYFDGLYRFPSLVNVQFESAAVQPPPVIPKDILENPIIVIYSASWATLIAIIVVIFWLHKWRKQ